MSNLHYWFWFKLRARATIKLKFLKLIILNRVVKEDLAYKGNFYFSKGTEEKSQGLLKTS